LDTLARSLSEKLSFAPDSCRMWVAIFICVRFHTDCSAFQRHSLVTDANERKKY
jgi:hypothetical protein